MASTQPTGTAGIGPKQAFRHLAIDYPGLDWVRICSTTIMPVAGEALWRAMGALDACRGSQVQPESRNRTQQAL